jgi:altronate dehydratase small subunit
MLTKKFIIVDVRDNVATSVQPLARGEVLEVREGDPAARVVINDDIPSGHKFALVAIGVDDPVVKYGETIGVASAAISPGDRVHVHNVEGVRGRGDKT